ncbi:MAG TPA: glycosyltransferase family 4 protein [Candidatus Limnocylindria bacterium]|jgi:glycosyltransferase involved in cell wall biosynthesis|nr:glycosyltransferase family 4 protein [Candidatus Limnocylindria bacterium]
MRLLYVCFDRGVAIGGSKGAGVHAAELLRALEGEGHDTLVLARAVATNFEARVPPVVTGAQLKLPLLRPRAVRRDVSELLDRRHLRQMLCEAISEFSPDAVYERHSLFHAETAAEAHRHGIPLVLEVNAPLAREQRNFRGLALPALAGRIERRAWASADLVVVPSRPLADLVRASGCKRVLVVPNAVDPALFEVTRADWLRAELGLEARYVVCYAGSLKPWHDLETVVEAVSRLPAELAPSMLVVGDGPERNRVVEQAESLGVNLHLAGAVEHGEVGRYMRAADVCVAPLAADRSLHYFSPLKALEYLAAGRPAVVAAAGDLADFAGAGAALSYPPRDAPELAKALARVATDAALRERLERSGRELARTRTWRAAARTIVEAIESLPSG